MDAVARQFEPTAPLPEAMALLAAASQQAGRVVPKAPKPGMSRRRREFRRNPGRIIFGTGTPQAPKRTLGTTPQPQFRRNLQTREAFARRAHDPRGRSNTRMAEALLMASSTRRAAPAVRRHTVTPRVAALDLIQRRAMATKLVGTLRHRFAQNVFDMRDGKVDRSPMQQARARYNWMPPLVIAGM